MNFGKLLGAGKTFFGSGGLVAYRQNKRVYLPKFNADKNPFTPKPAEPAPAAAPAAAPEAKNTSAPVVARTQKIPARSAAKPARAGWTSKLNPFRAPEPVSPPLPSAVQPEFSLDTVKVVRCDEVQWKFLGLSLAGYDVLISLAMAAIAARGAIRTAKRN